MPTTSHFKNLKIVERLLLEWAALTVDFKRHNFKQWIQAKYNLELSDVFPLGVLLFKSLTPIMVSW